MKITTKENTLQFFICYARSLQLGWNKVGAANNINLNRALQDGVFHSTCISKMRREDARLASYTKSMYRAHLSRARTQLFASRLFTSLLYTNIIFALAEPIRIARARIEWFTIYIQFPCQIGWVFIYVWNEMIIPLLRNIYMYTMYWCARVKWVVLMRVWLRRWCLRVSLCDDDEWPCDLEINIQIRYTTNKCVCVSVMRVHR